MNRTDRLMAILLEFQARGELRAEDLARRFEISVRTVYRDIQALSEGGVPVVATPGKGYRLMDGYFLPPLSFTESKAALLMLGGEFVRDRVDAELRRAADDARAKLAGILPPSRREDVARWRREIAFPTFGRLADDPGLPRLRSAIQQRRVVRLLYHAYRRDAPDERDVEPYRLVNLFEAWHLAAYCRLRQAPRFFRLDRIDRLDVLDERFTPAERHAVDPDHGEPIRHLPVARIRFDSAVVRWVRERQAWTFLCEEQDAAGPIFVYALRDESALLSWILSWGSAANVLGPLHLRARLTQEARAILFRHAGDTNLDDPSNIHSAPAITVSAALP